MKKLFELKSLALLTRALLVTFAISGVGMLAACDSNDGKAEHMGEEIDEAMEDAGDAIEDAKDDMGDAIEDAGDEAEDAADDAEDKM